MATSPSSYVCSCEDGWTGEQCETRKSISKWVIILLTFFSTHTTKVSDHYYDIGVKSHGGQIYIQIVL